MKAIAVQGGGDTPELQVVCRELPTLLPDAVLIKVAAAGINRADLLQRKGKYPPPLGASDILGLEVSGQVADIGANITSFKVGDRVCALLEGGGYAEYAVASGGQVLPIPDNLDFVQAASLPEACFTAWNNLFDYAKLQAGERLLVHGGTSGVGVIAVQIAKAFGVHCYATAGTEEKCAFLKGLGVEAICYKTQDFVSVVKQSGYVDVVLDMVGGGYFQRNMEVLAFGGRLVCLSFLAGAKAEVNFAPLLIKNLTIMGTTLRGKPASDKAAIARALQDQLWPRIASGAIVPVVDSVFALADAGLAHARMESGAHVGKIVLEVGEMVK